LIINFPNFSQQYFHVGPIKTDIDNDPQKKIEWVEN